MTYSVQECSAGMRTNPRKRGCSEHYKVLVRARTCVAVRAKKKLSNRKPETTTTQAVPSLSRARTCVPVRAKKKKKLIDNYHVNCDVIAPCPVIGLVNKWP